MLAVNIGDGINDNDKGLNNTIPMKLDGEANHVNDKEVSHSIEDDDEKGSRSRDEEGEKCEGDDKDEDENIENLDYDKNWSDKADSGEDGEGVGKEEIVEMREDKIGNEGKTGVEGKPRNNHTLLLEDKGVEENKIIWRQEEEQIGRQDKEGDNLSIRESPLSLAAAVEAIPTRLHPAEAIPTWDAICEEPNLPRENEVQKVKVLFQLNVMDALNYIHSMSLVELSCF